MKLKIDENLPVEAAALLQRAGRQLGHVPGQPVQSGAVAADKSAMAADAVDAAPMGSAPPPGPSRALPAAD